MTADPSRPDPPDGTTHIGADAPAVSPGPGWDHLEVRGEIGRGGFGRVYRAWDSALAREVALKIVKLDRADRAAAALHEGRMLARVRHRHVVTVYAARQVGGDVGLTMELIRGEHLGDYVRRQGPMSAEEATVVGLAVCQALAAVHAAGLLHRDIKARNVMREAGGRIVLMDFGTGVESGPAAGNDGPGGTGTPACMAPEVLMGGAATHASDLYSVAVLLFYLVTGEYPVPGSTAVAIAEAHAAGRRRLLNDLRSDLPDGFTRAIERGLNGDPSQRYQTAGAFIAALQAAMPSVRDAPIHVPPPAPAPATGSSWSRIATLAAAGLAGLWLLGLLTSVASNSTWRMGAFSDDTPLTWLGFGLRMVIPFLGPALVVVVLLYAVRAGWRIAPALVPPLAAPRARLESGWRRLRARLLEGPNASEAQYVLLAQVVTLAALVWGFRDVIGAFASFADATEPDTMTLLGGDRPNAYRITLTVAITLMALAWRAVLTRPSARMRADGPVVAGGIGIIVLLLVMLELPYRLVYHSERPVVAHGSQCCFDLGRRDDRVLLYCPTAPAPRIVEAAETEVTPPLLTGISLFWLTTASTDGDRTGCTAARR